MAADVAWRLAKSLAIQQTICDKRPEQLKMDFALWNRPAVHQHIKLMHNIKLSIRAVGNYLARWGFTPQKSIKKAYEQRPEAVQTWLGLAWLGLAWLGLA
ncbi:MAG: Winged helix-turn helix [Candidatus Nitrotoga sp. SPKER]|nr:MAG: Winged helix-turn helix [Candidatus Nitrotoga sp. SPKER]